MIGKLIHFLFYTCHQATFTIEKKLAHNIHWVEKIRLYFHLLFCKNCRNYLKKATNIDKTIKNLVEKQEITQNIDTHNLKKHIKEKIKTDGM